jgi:hypothetical protein
MQNYMIYKLVFSCLFFSSSFITATQQITSDHYLLDWWMTLFCRKLPLRLVARLWDLFLLAGEIELHKTAIALIQLHRDAILSAPDFDSVFRILNAPVDANESDFLALVSQVRVQEVWSAVLVKLEHERIK